MPSVPVKGMHVQKDFLNKIQAKPNSGQLKLLALQGRRQSLREQLRAENSVPFPK